MKYNISDLFFLSLRVTIGVSIYYKIGILEGFVLLLILDSINFYFMKIFFGLMSSLFLMMRKTLAILLVRNLKIVIYVGAIILEKCDLEKVKTQMYAKGSKFFRVESKLVKVFGKYYYKRMTPEEHKEKMPKFC